MNTLYIPHLDIEVSVADKIRFSFLHAENEATIKTITHCNHSITECSTGKCQTRCVFHFEEGGWGRCVNTKIKILKLQTKETIINKAVIV